MYPSKDDLLKKLTYDSHTHFFGVGLPAVDFIISKENKSLTLPDHLKSQKLIKGFGWSNALSLKELDTLCLTHSDKFFSLSYFDGHSSFISKNLIKELNFKPQKGQETSLGFILSEVERDDFLKLLPKRSEDDLEKMAFYAQKVFLDNNITKVRHLTGNFDHWTCLKKLSSQKKLNISIEVFFSEFMGQNLQEALSSFKKVQCEHYSNLTASGIKIFYDGSFGSNTAYVSSHTGALPRISEANLFEKMKFVLIDQNTPLAVHTIGDLALEDVIICYNKLTKESVDIPALHLEHAPIFSQKTLDTLKNNKLNCIFHFQPSHWIEDQKWYEENKKSLSPHKIYPFSFLDELQYEYHFGSDAPVVKPLKENTLLGLEAINKTISQI